MIKTVEQTKVSDIFSIKSNTIYRIPKYQREYTWGPSDWDALFNDVIENESGYFLGSYICVNNGSLNGTKLEVIDGQQRFTTLMLLMAVNDRLNLTTEEFMRADLDGNGELSAKEALKIINYINGTISSLR